MSSAESEFSFLYQVFTLADSIYALALPSLARQLPIAIQGYICARNNDVWIYLHLI